MTYYTEFIKCIEINDELMNVNIIAEANIFGENYGADADGNRGEWRTFIDDFAIQIYDKDNKDITLLVENNYKRIYEKLCNEAEHKLIELSNEDEHYVDFVTGEDL